MAEKKQVKKRAPERSQSSSPVEVVLQWLTYALWGLLLATVAWVVVIIATLVVRDEVLHDAVPYVVAATIVLLPLTLLADWQYRRREPAKKAGVAAVVMVVHAVLFALVAVGTLVGAVFTGVMWMLETSQDVSTYVISLVSLMAAVVLFGLLFARVALPGRLSTAFSVGMAVIASVLLVWAIAGPVVQFMERKDDRRIVDFAPAVHSAVSSYVDEHQRLPESLAEVEDMSADAQALVDDDLIEYKKGKVVNVPETGNREFRYQLCVTYEYASSEGAREELIGMDSGPGGYWDYLYIPSHPAGEVCYKLKSVLYEP